MFGPPESGPLFRTTGDSMAKIKLIPDPTFVAKVPLPIPGKEAPVDVEFTFKHRTRDQMDALVKRVQVAPGEEGALSDTQLVMECACGWELAEPFNEANVTEFATQYIAGPSKVFETYVAEMAGNRRKN
jgi:hypothetical protein